MFVDLDNFKSINDTYGHEAGDVVLQTVAKRLAHNARTDDTVSRYGGTNFCTCWRRSKTKRILQ
jgi:diguanylate cyclase (GGDEF)-like protein